MRAVPGRISEQTDTTTRLRREYADVVVRVGLKSGHSAVRLADEVRHRGGAMGAAGQRELTWNRHS